MYTSNRIENLERSVRRLQRAVFGLLLALVCIGLLGASSPQELTLHTLRIVDNEGRLRFALLGSVEGSGAASIRAFDEEGRRRIVVGTAGGFANVEVADVDEVTRLHLTAFREGWISVADSDGRTIWTEGIVKGMTVDDILKYRLNQDK